MGRYRYRIPSPLYELIDEVSKFYLLDRDGKIESCSRINNLLDVDSEHTKNIDPEKTVANIRIRHVSGFSAGVVGSIEDPELSAVLFANHAIEEAENRGEILSEAQQILQPDQVNSFNKEFYNSKEARSTYVLNSGEYLYIDPSVRPTFQAFRKICDADAETRRAFIKSPHAVLGESIDVDQDKIVEEIVSAAFVETSQFSERVTGVNKWDLSCY